MHARQSQVYCQVGRRPAGVSGKAVEGLALTCPRAGRGCYEMWAGVEGMKKQEHRDT